MYADRQEAGEKLSELLLGYRNCNGVVMALPRGGVPVAAVIAEKLDLPLEVMFVKKIGHPVSSEYAIGSVTLDNIYIDDHPEIPAWYIEEQANKIRELLKARQQKYYGNRTASPINKKIVILVDDGIATGSTLIAAIKDCKIMGAAKIVVAVAVSPTESAKKIKEMVDEFICPIITDEFYGVGQFYRDFSEVTDDEVKNLLSANETMNKISL